MAGHREACLKNEELNEVENNNISVEINSVGELEEDHHNDSSCSAVKRYPRYDLISLRSAQQSVHYPHCALRPELQALSIWSCRLRCELQYLGLWKIPHAGNLYGNCGCNGSCHSYTCETQSYCYSNYQLNSVKPQMCYENVQQSQQLHQTNSSPTLGNKKTIRSRERFLNYQRGLNNELIRETCTSPNDHGEASIQQHLNHQVKPAVIDHRSISSSHLMPAFAKRRMSHANVQHTPADVACNFNSNVEHSIEPLCNDDAANEGASHMQTSIKSRKDSMKVANNLNDYHLYKASTNRCLDKNDQLIDNHSGWINLVKKIKCEFSPSNTKPNSKASVNKKLINERRIGSGRLVHIEKENTSLVNNNGENDNNISSCEVDKSIPNFACGRYLDSRAQERHIFERRVSNAEDTITSKRCTITNIGEERSRLDSSYHQHGVYFTGQRSMSFRRREYVEQKDYHREFHESKDLREGRESREQRDQHHRHNHYRDHKEEPEWYIEGPTSQHDTIELRGFEESDDYQLQKEQTYFDQCSKIERKTPEGSPISHNSNSNIHLSSKDNLDSSNESSTNSNNTTNTIDMDIENVSSCNSSKDTITANIELSGVNKPIADIKHTVSKFEEYDILNKRTSNVTELFFDNFLNIDSLENTLISSENLQSITINTDDSKTSRFSRWFLNTASNEDTKNEINTSPPNQQGSKQPSKDLNEGDFNSFMYFLKSNNFPRPELPKGLPSNVSAVSVEELEAKMRKVDLSENEKYEDVNHHLHKTFISQSKRSECEKQSDKLFKTTERNSQEMEAFRKLLDQLGKPQADITMHVSLPTSQVQAQSLATSHVAFPSGAFPISPSNSLHQLNITKHDYLMKGFHPQQPIIDHQQNLSKMVTSSFQHQNPHYRVTQMSPQQQGESMPLMLVPPHPYTRHMPMMPMSYEQKRHEVQHLIQCIVREELSRSFLEKELKNPNISPYTKEIILTVLKETSRCSLNLADSNIPDAIETSSNNNISAASNNLMQSLARGEVSLNLLERELEKLNNTNIVNETSVSGAYRERSRCGSPSSSPFNNVSALTNCSVNVPLSPEVIPAANQNSILTNDRISANQHHHEPIFSMLRPHHHEDTTLHLPTQRELQIHTQAIMQNALFKKKMAIEQHEALRRRQEIHKYQELESATITQQQQLLNLNSAKTQQLHPQSSGHINSSTPLAFTPTSVLRKMTAEKESITSSIQLSTTASATLQKLQPRLQQSYFKIPTHSQISYQHSNQPRMILGGGNVQYMHQQQLPNNSPQISPQQKSQIRNQPPGPSKWPIIHSSVESNYPIHNNMNNKPMGRPILKGPGPVQPLVAHNPIVPNTSNMNQNSQSIETVSQMQKYPLIQHPRQIVGQQFSSHIMRHQIPTPQQNNIQQHLFQQQRSVVMQRQQTQHSHLGTNASLPQPSHHPSCNDSNSVNNLNYQRDGSLSPTSNQLAQWFSPELLAQASAGKLPLLTMNQALSLEEFERSIQHSSTTVNN